MSGVSHRVVAVSPVAGLGVALIHIVLTDLPLPARSACAAEVTRGGLRAGAAVHAGPGLALGNVSLAHVALVTLGTRAGEAGQAAGAEAPVLTRRVPARVRGHTGVTRVPGQTRAGHALASDLTPGVCWTPHSLAPGLHPDLAPLSLVTGGAGAGGGLASHTGAAIQTEARHGQTRVSDLEWNIIKIEILLLAPPRFWSQDNTLDTHLGS